MITLKSKSLFFFVLITTFCILHSAQSQPCDPKAFSETKALYKYLDSTRKVATLFGQQYSLFTRHRDKENTYGESEVFQVCGKYAAVHGWDFGDLFPYYFRGKFYNKANDRAETIQQIKNSHLRGGIHTFSFHMDNPFTGKNSWDTTRVLYSLLPGGAKHQWYLNKLDTIAEFFNQLKSEDGKYIPVIYRPFHEHNGKWFWWGKPHATKDEFVQLWRFTVDYFRENKQLHHLLFAYSPDTCATEQEYLEYYPGDAYVDVLGMDIYRDVEDKRPDKMANRLKMLVLLAEKRGKIPALTETGYAVRTEKNWYTGFLTQALTMNPEVKRLAYALLWGNFGKVHYFSIYPGHFNEYDFIEFSKNPFFHFENNFKNQ